MTTQCRSYTNNFLNAESYLVVDSDGQNQLEALESFNHQQSICNHSKPSFGNRQIEKQFSTLNNRSVQNQIQSTLQIIAVLQRQCQTLEDLISELGKKQAQIIVQQRIRKRRGSLKHIEQQTHNRSSTQTYFEDLRPSLCLSNHDKAAQITKVVKSAMMTPLVSRQYTSTATTTPLGSRHNTHNIEEKFIVKLPKNKKQATKKPTKMLSLSSKCSKKHSAVTVKKRKNNKQNQS